MSVRSEREGSSAGRPMSTTGVPSSDEKYVRFLLAEGGVRRGAEGGTSMSLFQVSVK